MVFTWVSTGVVEPYTPPPLTRMRVPSTHGTQGSKQTDNETGALDHPDFGGSGSSLSPRMREQIQAYESSSKVVESGDRLRYVYEIMTEEVDTLFEKDSLEDAKRKFRGKRYRHIPILNYRNQLAGIFSDRDMLRLIADETPLASYIQNHMVSKILTADPDTLIRDAAMVLVSEKVGCLPVINREQELIGMLTRSDILKSIIRKPPLQLFA